MSGGPQSGSTIGAIIVSPPSQSGMGLFFTILIIVLACLFVISIGVCGICGIIVYAKS
jgi:hypothetical protein